jgi:Domain of unknown function (DUF3303)
MSTWSVRPGCRNEAIQRFLAGKGAPAAGVTMLGRWHATDLSMGFTLYESNNPAAMYETAAMWSDVLELHSHTVIEDAEAGPVLAKVAGK